MTEAEVVEYFSNLVEKQGPDPAEYPTVLARLDALHRQKFIARNGMSICVKESPAWGRFLKENGSVFRTTATMQGFAASKPNGYAGDFEIIERIYNRTVSGSPELRKWDEFFHNGQAPASVRNRAGMLRTIVRDEAAGTLLSVGCGPGLDVARALRSNCTVRHVSLLDNDPRAIDRCRSNINSMLGDNITADYHHKNALRFRPEMKYDVIWSSGLFDYLNDKIAIFLLKRLREMSAPGGVVAFGNFGQDNASRSYMELVGEWFLLHRSENMLADIAISAGYTPDMIAIKTDETGLNHFVVARAPH